MLTCLKPPKHTLLLTEVSETQSPENFNFGITNAISLEFSLVSNPNRRVFVHHVLLCIPSWNR